MHFDTPNIQTLKSKVLSLITIKLCQFKSKSMMTYIFGSKKCQNPCQDTPTLTKRLTRYLLKVVNLTNGRLVQVVFIQIKGHK